MGDAHLLKQDKGVSGEPSVAERADGYEAASEISRSETQPTPAHIALSIILEAIYALDDRSGNETNL